VPSLGLGAGFVRVRRRRGRKKGGNAVEEFQRLARRRSGQIAILGGQILGATGTRRKLEAREVVSTVVLSLGGYSRVGWGYDGREVCISGVELPPPKVGTGGIIALFHIVSGGDATFRSLEL
jgi:hypothetical protein